MSILHMARRRALVEEVPAEPLQISVTVTLHELLEVTLHLIDGAADLIAFFDHALRRGLVAVEEQRPAVRVVFGISEQLEKSEAPEILLVVVTRRPRGQLERLVVRVADRDRAHRPAVLAERDAAPVLRGHALILAAHRQELLRVRLPDPRQPAVLRAVQERRHAAGDWNPDGRMRLLVWARADADLANHVVVVDLAGRAELARVARRPPTDDSVVRVRHLEVLALVLEGVVRPRLQEDLDVLVVALAVLSIVLFSHARCDRR